MKKDANAQMAAKLTLRNTKAKILQKMKTIRANNKNQTADQFASAMEQSIGMIRYNDVDPFKDK